MVTDAKIPKITKRINKNQKRFFKGWFIPWSDWLAFLEDKYALVNTMILAPAKIKNSHNIECFMWFRFRLNMDINKKYIHYMIWFNFKYQIYLEPQQYQLFKKECCTICYFRLGDEQKTIINVKVIQFWLMDKNIHNYFELWIFFWIIILFIIGI